MCREMVFAGHCTACGQAYDWVELSVELSCLEAKNSGAFGNCECGIIVERHDYDQECEKCSPLAVPEADEEGDRPVQTGGKAGVGLASEKEEEEEEEEEEEGEKVEEDGKEKKTEDEEEEGKGKGDEQDKGGEKDEEEEEEKDEETEEEKEEAV
ncbi:hypothetical protein P8C59_004403 [Phyllachora maydis]|uniref:Uncharacterized protein n=1 Tax=Phyllachora maydis TaxID=1825666 RepID=A0AAD9MDF7_9PEZI|nr:hypothetical protein P8C59_004403 [Phyllachora maydis]